MNTIGNRIKCIRKSENLKQLDFANRVLVSASYISKVESDKEIPSEIFTKLISLEFGISYEWLKNGEGDMRIQNNVHDYFERDVKMSNVGISAEIEQLNDSVNKVIQNCGTFRKMCLSEIFSDLSEIINLNITDKKKDLVIEILADYVGDLNELVKKIIPICGHDDSTEQNQFYISSYLKNTEKLFNNLSDLLAKIQN